MSRVLEPHDPNRGAELLLAHCSALERLAEPHRPVAERLSELIGLDLTRLLLVALSDDHRAESRGLAL